MANFKPALSTNEKNFDESLFRLYSEAGLCALEVSKSRPTLDELDYVELSRYAEKYGVEMWSFHLPFSPMKEIDISRPDLTEYTMELYKHYIKRINTEAGIKIFVVHPSGEPIDPADRPMRIACAKKNLAELAEYAKSFGAVIAVEDLPRQCLGNCSAELLELVSAHPDLRICFDTNHLLGEDIVEFIHKVGSKIVTTHFSDFDYINERHWLPGEGSIDWPALIQALEDVGYEGYILYELGYGTPWSLDRPRDLTPADFKRNFDELVAKKQPTRIGTPKAKLGMWKIEE